MDDTWVKIKSQELEAFTQHINSVDSNIHFTREDVKDNRLPFLDCAVAVGKDGNLSIEVYRKPTHTDQYLLFDSHHPRNINWELFGLYNTGPRRFHRVQRGNRRKHPTSKQLSKPAATLSGPLSNHQ